jgi:hypothetical protein
MFDETRFVRKSSALLVEPVLKWCERTLPTRALDPNTPGRGGNMRPSDRRPARNQDTAGNHEENKT